jgi:Glutamine amidotransferases class-II
MCLLTFMNEYTTASVEDLTVGADNNPDGFGFAIHAGTHIVRGNGLVFDHVIDEFVKQRAVHSGPALFHSRITTHGGTTVDNCHPFQVGSDDLTVMAHNGMLPIAAKNGRSDTRILAEDMLPEWGGAPILNSRKRRKKLGKFADGSKLVFLSANPDVQENYYIINESLGHWVGDVWWSNSSYNYSRYSYSGAGMYTSGWSKTPSDVSSSLYVPSHERVLVEDCSYINNVGDEVWGEMWNCAVCTHSEYVDEHNINTADFCPSCDACWFCFNDRLMCECSWDNYQDSHSVRDYDSAIDYF